MIWVSWHNATNYAAWLTKERNDGYTYRLPTEVEWEYACKADTNTPYNTGNEFPGPQRKNNYLFSHGPQNPEAHWPHNMDPKTLSKLHVGKFPPISLGFMICMEM